MSLCPPPCTCHLREHACSPPCRAHPELGGGLGNPGTHDAVIQEDGSILALPRDGGDAILLEGVEITKIDVGFE